MSTVEKTKVVKGLDMTEGEPTKLLLVFALPIFLSNLFQQFYNIFDTSIAGHVLGENALAAIGATSALYSLLIGLANGMNNGYALIVSRFFGKKDYDNLRTSVAWMFILNVLNIALFTIGLLAFLPFLMRVLNTPEEILESATLYISVIGMGIPATIAYNMESSLLRAIGNSRRPLIYLIISSVLNVILDVLFIVTFKWGVAGLAIATVVAQAVSTFICLVDILRNYTELLPTKQNWKASPAFVNEMFTTGLSMGLMSAIFAIGSVILQSSINALGSTIIASQTAARKLYELLIRVLTSLMIATATYVSQNFGAGKYKRIKEGLITTFKISFVYCAVCLIAMIFGAHWAVKTLSGSTDPEVIANGVLYLRCCVPMFFPLIVLLILRTALQSMRHKIAPLICSSIELVGKVIFAKVIVPEIGYLGVCLCEPILWGICVVYIVGVMIYYRKELQ